MDQVQRGLRLLRPPRLSSDQFRQLIRQRGWRMADAAVRWNIRPDTLSHIAADSDRELRWDELARALPQLSRPDRAAATAARLFLYPPRPRRAKDSTCKDMMDENGPSPSTYQPENLEDDAWDEEPYTSLPDGFRYQDYVGLGSELVAVTEIGSFAREGAVLLVVDTRLGMGAHGDAHEQYLCESPQGATLWLEPDQMDDWVVSTGITRQGF